MGEWRGVGGGGILERGRRWPWASRGLRAFWTEVAGFPLSLGWLRGWSEWPQVPISQPHHFGRGHWSGFESGSPGVGSAPDCRVQPRLVRVAFPLTQNLGAHPPVLGGGAQAGGSWGGQAVCRSKGAKSLWGPGLSPWCWRQSNKVDRGSDPPMDGRGQ